MGQPKTQLILAAPTSSPRLRCEFISYSNYVEAPKKFNYVDKPVGPNISIALGGSIFSMRHLLVYGHRTGGSRLYASPRTVLSRFLSFVQHVHNGRQRRRGERTKAQEEIRPPEEVPY